MIKTELQGDIKTVMTEEGCYQAQKLILANGSTPRKLDIPGEAGLTGKGMGLNAARDGALYAGKNMYVVGGADGAVKEALYLSQFAKTVTIIHFEDQLGCIAEFKNKLKDTANMERPSNTDIYPELVLENGYIPVNDKMETAIPGVYAAGDIRVKQVRQAATAVADGAVAAINAAV